MVKHHNKPEKFKKFASLNNQDLKIKKQKHYMNAHM